MIPLRSRAKYSYMNSVLHAKFVGTAKKCKQNHVFIDLTTIGAQNLPQMISFIRGAGTDYVLYTNPVPFYDLQQEHRIGY
jgi:hypothetical protein